MEVLQRTANRGSVSTGYDIDHSVKLEDANNEWLYRASPTAGNRKTYTFSFWIKRTEIGTVNGSGNQFVIGQGQHGRMYFGSDYFQYRFDDGHDCRNVSRQFRDTSAWYHFVVSVDTNQSSSSNRVKLYVNGESLAVDDHDGGSFPDIQDSGAYFSTSYLTIGTAPFGGSYNSGDGDYETSGYLAEFCGIDGTAYAPTDFGEFDEDSGIWKPKDVSELTFGSEGFYLNFSNASNLGEDFSGNDNDFASSNLAATDQATDTPTNNFVTFNPLNPTYASSVISEGGTKLKGSGQNTFDNIQTTIGVTKGKWYCELEPEADTAAQNTAWGVVNLDTAVYAGDHYAVAGFWSAGFDDGRLAWHFYNGGNAGTETVNYGTGSGDTAGTHGIALDLDNGTLKFYIRNTQLSISASSLPAGTYAFFGDVMGTNAPYLRFNFGGYTTNSISSAATDANGYGTFEYAPPSGYYALCTKNLAEFG